MGCCQNQMNINTPPTCVNPPSHTEIGDSGLFGIGTRSQDIGALQADGYLGDVIASLRAAQEGAAAESADVARDALALLAGILDERRAGARAAP